FQGTVADADVTLGLDAGSLRTSFAGRFDGINPTVALSDDRFAGKITGAANVGLTVRDLLTRTPELADYEIEGSVDLASWAIRDLAMNEVHVQGALKEGIGHFSRVEMAGPGLEGRGSGTIAFKREAESAFDYEISRADLARLNAQTGRPDLTGVIETKGRLA